MLLDSPCKEEKKHPGERCSNAEHDVLGGMQAEQPERHTQQDEDAGDVEEELGWGTFLCRKTILDNISSQHVVELNDVFYRSVQTQREPVTRYTYCKHDI